MPTPAEAVYNYRRKSREEYAIWFGKRIGLSSEESRPAATVGVRNAIEAYLRSISKAKVDAIVEEAASEESTGEDDGVAEPPVSETVAPADGVEDIPNSEDFPAELSYDAMTLNELREECASRGLPVSGTKAQLALRLKRDDEGITESAPTPEAPDEAAAEQEEVDAPADEAAATEVEMNAEDTEQEPTTETNE